MKLLPLAHACKGAAETFPDRYEELRDSLAAHYRAYQLRPNERLDIECALFIFWSVEIGLRNTETWWFDRHLAETRFFDLVRQGLRHPLAEEIAAGPGMEKLYRNRFRDVLRTIRNIHVTWDDGGRLRVPLTERTAKLFLACTTDSKEHIPVDARQALHRFLVDECRAYVLGILSGCTPLRSVARPR